MARSRANSVIVTKRLAPPNSVLLVMDHETGEIPADMHDGSIAATESCVAIGTLCEVDGETTVEVSDEDAFRAACSGLACVFRGMIATPQRKLHVCTVTLTSLAELAVP